MELNNFLFPIPRPSYSAKSFKEKLFYIPHKGDFKNHQSIKSKRAKLKSYWLSISSKPIKESKDVTEKMQTSSKWARSVPFGFPDINQSTDATQFAKEDFSNEEVEISRDTKVYVPSFQKQISPFKNEKKKQINGSIDNYTEPCFQPVDYKCMIIENYKGYSQSAYIKDHIPWLFLRNYRKTNKITIYFHGNAEDLGGAYHFLKYFQFRIETHIIYKFK